MSRTSAKPEGIPKPITPSNSAATDPLDQGDGVPAAEPRPALTGARRKADRPAASTAPRGAKPAAGGESGAKPAAGGESGAMPPPGRQPSDAAPPDDGPLESLGKAVSAPVREADRRSGGRGGAPR